MYTRLITRIETTCSRLGKDDKFQLFVCLAVHDRLLGRIVTDLTKAVAAQQVCLFTKFKKKTISQKNVWVELPYFKIQLYRSQYMSHLSELRN